jgi:hypothetical protein
MHQIGYFQKSRARNSIIDKWERSIQIASCGRGLWVQANASMIMIKNTSRLQYKMNIREESSIKLTKNASVLCRPEKIEHYLAPWVTQGRKSHYSPNTYYTGYIAHSTLSSFPYYLLLMVLVRWFSTHIIFNIHVGMRLYQYLDHFRAAFLGCKVKSCLTILWGKVQKQ